MRIQRETRVARDNVRWLVHNIVFRPVSEVLAWIVPVYGEYLSDKLLHTWLPKDYYMVGCGVCNIAEPCCGADKKCKCKVDEKPPEPAVPAA